MKEYSPCGGPNPYIPESERPQIFKSCLRYMRHWEAQFVMKPDYDEDRDECKDYIKITTDNEPI